MISALMFSALTALPLPQLDLDDGWLAWQGCWRASGDQMGSMVCIVPAGAGVRMRTIAKGVTTSEVTLVADGVARPIAREGCTGTQQARWSDDRQRLFLRSQMTCGESMQRTVDGIMAMQTGAWLSVQAVTSGSNTTTHVERFTEADPASMPAEIAASLSANRLARETARWAAGAWVDLADIREAVAETDVTAVTSWLTALNQTFDLTGEKLVQLADAGVPPAVIDVLVAVSNPEHFAVKTPRARVADDERPFYGSSCYGSRDPWLGPMGYYSYGYDQCYYGYSRGYSPFGFNRWGWGYSTPVVVVREPVTRNPSARVTRNGYTKGGSSGSSIPRDNSTVSRPSSGGSSTGSASSGGSSGSSTGRTAKPRDS
ncbi:MAG: hypothetical protein ACT443_02955 [Gemmatimonadota bacterium]